MAAAAQAYGRDQVSRRRGLRYRAEVPLYVTVLRSGSLDTLPGRSVNSGEGGVAAVLAGELLPGEAVERGSPAVAGVGSATRAGAGAASRQTARGDGICRPVGGAADCDSRLV